MKKLISIVLVLVLALSVVPAAAFAKTAEAEPEKAPEQQTETRTVYPGNVILDENSSGGYEGDYVVIYNPGTSSSNSYSTDTMTGLIETTIEPSIVNVHGENTRSNVPANSWKLDIDGMLDEQARRENPDYGKDVPGNENATKASYSVGSTKTFTINSSYSPTGSSSVQFKCLAVGSHCYIWTPTSTASNVYPLDSIDSSYADLAAAEFDSKFDLMQSSFGNHTNSTNGDGKLHILYYNINEGWSGSGGYIGGFFWQTDISNNGLPMLNIDTYPSVYYTSGNYTYKSMDNTYNTMVHEYQHLIHYSNASSDPTWLNECWSAAAEEICYPGSSIVDRIQSWENHYYSTDWLNPPKEFEYNPTACPNLHQGYSMYAWSNDLDDVLALYGQVSLYAQFIFSRYGNTTYKNIMTKTGSGSTFASAFQSVTGEDLATFTKEFRVALTANTAANVLDNKYHFVTQDGYDPAQYNDVENPYSLLAPIIFTGTSCTIKGGGAICVKPVNGVYNPPSGASSSLKYIGVKFVRESITGVTLNDMNIKVGSIVSAALTVLPADTADYTATYTSSNPLIFTVDANGKVAGQAPGSATLSVVVHDNVANTDYNASATVTVENFHGYVRTDTVEVGEKYLIITDSAVSGTTGYAVGNQAPANNHYMSASAVTILTDDCVAYDSSIDFDAITWIPAGNAANGYTWQNVGNSTYIGTDSSDYVCPSTTSQKWLYESGRGFKLTSTSSSYPYLYYSVDNTRYTTATVADPARLYKYVAPVTPAYTISAVSNNDSYGTVSVTGTVITCTPAAGYYVESCTVTAGTATYTINGNTVTVSPESDCTIRVNFAPKPQYTVNYIASGAAEGSATAYLDDAITLPATVSVNPDGWTFAGWVTAQVEETADEPNFYAPGASYTVTGNATLYALYSRVDGSGGTETVYQLVTSAPSSWAGNYVITNNPTSITNMNSAYVLKGVTGSSSGTNAESASNCTVFSSTGITQDGEMLKNVPSDYVMTVAASGSYYSIKAPNNTYYGMNSSSYLYSYSSYNSSYCAWTPSINTSGVAQLKNSRNGSYPYFGWSTSNNYFWSASTNNANVLRLWKETQITTSTTYYCTDPVVAQPTYYTVTFVDWDGTEIETQQVLEGAAATAPADPVREGYTFTGWDVDFSNVTSDLTVTAQYTVTTYTVTFKDWDGTTLGTDEVEYGGTAVAPVTPTREGYTFTGWSSSLENITANKTVYAMYDILTFTVTFKDWDGTVLKTQTVNYGGSATAPADPEREGYTFTGWDVAFTNIKADTVVTAQYTIRTFTVTFVDYDGTVLKTETVDYGAAATAPADPEREGYVFTGWDVDFSNVTENLTVTAQYIEEGLEPTLLGDVNCDGKVDSTDALLAMRASMGLATISAQGLVNGDMNGDGNVNATDAVLIMRVAMGSKFMPLD